MIASTSLLLVYGGTFDPVHQGHVTVAKAAMQACAADRVLLVPCGDPPHRDAPRGSGALRAELLRLAFADDPRFVVDERELRRPGPSYMVDTLADIRREIGAQTPLGLLLGVDAARGLTSWQRWADIPALAHLVLVPRPGDLALADRAIDGAWRRIAYVRMLQSAPAGLAFCLPEALSDASSTSSRRALARGDAASADLPPAVRSRLIDDATYRTRAATGEK